MKRIIVPALLLLAGLLPAARSFAAAPASDDEGLGRYTLGQHSGEILSEAGFTADQIAQLRADGTTR